MDRPPPLIEVLPHPATASPRRIRDGASPRYVLTVAAPAFAGSKPAEPDSGAERVGRTLDDPELWLLHRDGLGSRRLPATSRWSAVQEGIDLAVIANALRAFQA